jgi:hypothetical protein
MPKYRIDLPDGRAVMVDAANPQEAADGASAWASPGKTPAQQRASADAQKRLSSVAPWEMGVGQGAAFNLGDELDAASAAGETGVNNFVRRLTGQPDVGYGMSDAYKAVADADRARLAKNAHDHPAQMIGGGVLGAIANPLNKLAGGFVAASSGIPTAMLRGAITGGGLGALYGAGAGAPGQRIPSAVSGAAAGAVTGGVLPPIAAGIGAAGRHLAGTASDVASGTRAVLNPPDPMAASTSRDTQDAFERFSALMRASGKTADDLVDPMGKDLTTAEAMGRTGVTSLGAMARRSGTTPDALEATLRSRAQAAPSRILDDFAAASGIHPEEAAGDIEALTSRLQGEAKPLFDAALSHPGPVWNNDLAQLAQRPVVKKAIASAAEDLMNAGKDPTAMGLKLDPDTGWSLAGGGLTAHGGLEGAGSFAGASEPQPTAETWDLIRKRIGDQVERNPITNKIVPDSVSRGNFNVNVARRDLTHALAGDPAHGVEGAIPGYRAALDKSGDYLQLQSAFDRAQDTFLNPNVKTATFAKTFGALSEPEQAAWKSGVAAKLESQLQNGRLTPRQLLLPHVQDKLTAVLGPDAAAQFTERLQAEAQLAATGSRMMPGVGSPTAEFGAAMAEHEGGPTALGLLARAHKDPVSTISNLAALGRSLGTSPQVRNELGRLLMQPPELTASDFAGFDIPRLPGLATPRLPYPAAAAAAGTLAAQRRK